MVAKHYFSQKMDAARSSETLVSHHITTRRHNPENCYLKISELTLHSDRQLGNGTDCVKH